MTKITGYTTINSDYTSTTLSGIELAKRDLLNHFNIRKGEKWTNPEYGSLLPYLIFQPLDQETIDLIEQDVFTIVGSDPRFEMTNGTVIVREEKHSITVNVELMYLPTTTATDLQIKFDREFNEKEEF